MPYVPAEYDRFLGVPRVVRAIDPHNVFIGRPSKWGNPWSHKEGTTAEFRTSNKAQAIAAYEKWIVTQPTLMAALGEIKGKVLGCPGNCAPGPCHGDVLLRLANPELPFNIESPLKWAGSKRALLPRLVELYAPHRHRRLIEPFVGGMNVALGLQPDDARLSDVNPHLVNFWYRLRDPRPFSLKMENDERLYYAYRDCFNAVTKLDGGQGRWSATAAELFYFLNRTGFNGLCRFNASGEFNVPFGKYKTINYRVDFSEYAPLMQRWSIACLPFNRVQPRPDDFVYLDPPYDGTFADYSAGGFDWADQVVLANLFAAHPGPVVASNAATSRILTLYRDLGFHVETVEVKRSIAANGDREPALEMLATKNVEKGGMH